MCTKYVKAPDICDVQQNLSVASRLFAKRFVNKISDDSVYKSYNHILGAKAPIYLLVTPVLAQQLRVIFSKEDCKRFARHHPSVDVRYKSGSIYVKGRLRRRYAAFLVD